MTYFFQELVQHGNNIALIEGDNTVTYVDLAKRVEEKATSIQTEMERVLFNSGQTVSKAVQPTKHLVGMIAENSVATVVNYLALLSLSYPILFLTKVQVDSHQSSALDEATTDIFGAYRINFVVHEDSFQTLHPACQNQESSPSIQDNIALLLSTSGSTGTSKQVVLSYDNLQANCDSICAYLPIEKTDVTITTLPFNYSYGLSIINTHLAVGASIVMTSFSVMQREFWQLFDRHAVTSFGGVPHSYEMLLRLRFTTMALPSLKYFTQAGGKLSADRVKQLATYATNEQKSFFVMYGQTEATARMAYADHTKLLQKPETIGQAIPNTKLRIEAGELVFSGNNVMLGYANASDDLQSMPGIKELHTGDIAYQDDDGDYFITGRSKRIVKLFGERLSLDALQHDLLKLIQIKSSAADVENVLCVGDDKRLYIVLVQGTATKQSKTDSELAFTTIKQHMRDLNIHASALKFDLIHEAPLTANGKVDYPNLLIALQGNKLTSDSVTEHAGDRS